MSRDGRYAARRQETGAAMSRDGRYAARRQEAGAAMSRDGRYATRRYAVLICSEKAGGGVPLLFVQRQAYTENLLGHGFVKHLVVRLRCAICNINSVVTRRVLFWRLNVGGVQAFWPVDGLEFNRLTRFECFVAVHVDGGIVGE